MIGNYIRSKDNDVFNVQWVFRKELNMGATIKIALAMIIWGSIGIVVKAIDLPSIEVGFMRAFISGLLLLVFRLVFNKGKVNYTIKSVFILIASGAGLGLNWIFLFNAYKYTTLTNATVSYYMAPVIAVGLARLFLKEKLTFKRIVSMFVSTLGMVLILSQAKQMTVEGGNVYLGIVSGLLAAVFYAVVMVVNRAVKDVSGLDKTLIQILSAAVILLPLIVVRRLLVIPNQKTMMLLLVIGIVHTAIPYLLYFHHMKNVSILNSAVLSYVDPFSAVLFGYFIFGEPLGLYHLLGGSMILLSIVLSLDKVTVSSRETS